MALKLTSLSLNLPFGLGGATIEIGEAERLAAWKLYVELSTRVSSQPLEPGAGSVREALSSLYKLFDITRDVLKTAGPDIGGSTEGLGPTAIRILNQGLRPFLAKWHAVYSDYEGTQMQKMIKELDLKSVPPDLVDQAHWEKLEEFYDALEDTRRSLEDYIIFLAKVCGVVQPNKNEIATRD